MRELFVQNKKTHTQFFYVLDIYKTKKDEFQNPISAAECLKKV